MAVHTSFASFNLAIEKFAHHEVPEIQRGRILTIALTAAKSLTELTRVDTGRAKGNWQFTISEPAEGQIERLDPTAQGASGSAALMDVMTRIKNWKPGDWVWFHNGVLYIGILNDGTATREGDYMLQRTVEYIERWAGS